jgi:hypothetical protein
MQSLLGYRNGIDLGCSEAIRAISFRSVRRLLLADTVTKVFSASGRATLIQNQALMRNLDSEIHSSRFGKFQISFHRFYAVTFATVSALLGPIGMSV